MSRSRLPVPFQSDAECVEAELGWLRVRCQRLMAEGKQRETEQEEADADPAFKARPGHVDARLAKCKVREAREVEDALRADLDARVAAHRADPEAPALGLLKVIDQHGLGEPEKIALLTVLGHALGSEIEEWVFDGFLPPAYSGPDVGDTLKCVAPEGVAGHVAARRIFRPGSNLMRSGLVVLDENRTGPTMADTILHQGIHLSLAGLAAIFSDPEAMTEMATAGVTSGHDK